MRALPALLALSILAPLPLAAHARHRLPARAEEAAKIHRIEKLADNVYCIFGQGGNIGLVVTARHAILVDDQFERLVPGLLDPR